MAIQQTNINGVFFLVKEQIKTMEKQERLVTPLTSEARPAERGSIVVLSSAAAVIAVPEGGAYTHTKFATNGLTKAAGTSRFVSLYSYAKSFVQPKTTLRTGSVSMPSYQGTSTPKAWPPTLPPRPRLRSASSTAAHWVDSARQARLGTSLL